MECTWLSSIVIYVQYLLDRVVPCRLCLLDRKVPLVPYCNGWSRVLILRRGFHK